MAESRGKRFEKKLLASLEALPETRAERIKDATYWNGHRMVSQETPADFRVDMAGDSLIGVLIEAKAVSGKSLAFDRLKDHQRDALTDFERFHKDTYGWVAVNFYDPNNIRRMDECYMVPINLWNNLAEYSGRKSLPLETCETDARIIRCPKIKGAIYDMTFWRDIAIHI